jgi:hypothetical protein
MTVKPLESRVYSVAIHNALEAWLLCRWFYRKPGRPAAAPVNSGTARKYDAGWRKLPPGQGFGSSPGGSFLWER